MSGIGNAICALNKIGKVDQAFFIICAVIVVLIVAIYFLIPVFNKKLYKEQRDNLHKREAAFKYNLNKAQTAESETVQETEAETPVESPEE